MKYYKLLIAACLFGNLVAFVIWNYVQATIIQISIILIAQNVYEGLKQNETNNN